MSWKGKEERDLSLVREDTKQGWENRFRKP